MATQNLATADAILKDLYVGPIVEQLNQKTYMLDQIDRDSDHIDHTGRRAIVPVHRNRNRGRGSTGDSGTLPVAGRQDAIDAIVPIRYHYQGIEISDGLIEATDKDEGAFVSALEWETKGAATDMRKDVNRQSFGTGDGLLANVTTGGTAGTATFTVDSVQYLRIGDVVDVLLRSTGSSAAGLVSGTVTARAYTGTVASATQAQGTITLSVGSTGTVDNTFGVYVSGNYKNEMDGLRNIAGTTNRVLHSIDSSVSTNTFWNPASLPTGGLNYVTAGESAFEQLADYVGQTGNGEVEVFITTRGIRRRLADTYTSQKRYNDKDAVKIHGGFSAIMVNEIPAVADDDCPKGFVFAFNKSALKWFEQTKPGFLEGPSGYTFHLKDGAGAGTKVSVWQAWFRWYAALGSVAPNRTGALTQCADDKPADY